MDDFYLYHLIRMAIASALCTAMIGFGLFFKRGDRSRRWLFVVAGFLGAIMTIITIVVGTNSLPREFNPFIAIVGGCALLLPAAVMIFFGWRGRRVGDHPHCRHCGFDLFGKPPESTRCNECGADLARPRSIAIGVHEARRGLILVGLFLLILSLMISGVSVRMLGANVDMYRYLPTWWLIHDLDSPISQRPAEQMLERELQSDNLTSWQARQIAWRVLKDLDAGRVNMLLYPLIFAIDRHDLLDEQTTRRLMRVLQRGFFFATTPMAVRGRPILIFDPLLHDQGQPSPMWGLTNLSIKPTSIVLKIGAYQVRPDQIVRTRVDENNVQGGDGIALNLGDDWAKIPAGVQHLTQDASIDITMNYRGKELKETTHGTSSCLTHVVTASEATVPMNPPTDMDGEAVWSATTFAVGGRKGIELHRSQFGSRIFARAALIDAGGRHEIGIAVFNSMTESIGMTTSVALSPGQSRIELVPAPADAAGGWDDRAILNQTIVITDIQPPSQ